MNNATVLMVREAINAFDPRARMVKVAMLDVQRMAEAPVIDVHLTSISAADTCEELCSERRWTSRRTGPFDVEIDSSPRFMSNENENYDSVWSDD